MCYQSAAAAARERAAATGRPYVVNEIVRRCIVQPEEK